jgi:endonuclease/exonuclease/phosphatase family metal-dependent hydrolase
MTTPTSQTLAEANTQTLTVQDFLGGEFTSDHTWQSVEVWLETRHDGKTYQQASDPIRLTTWNMLNQCFSRETNPFGGKFGNNPFDLYEHWPAYIVRKTVQIKELDKIIDTIQSDFLLLQECDWVTDDQLLNQYKRVLNSKGYDLIVSPRSEPDQPAQKLLVTVYNQNKFEVVANSGQGVFATKKENQNPNFLGTYCGYAIEFKNKQNQQVATVVNLHLDFTHDYEQEISDFLKAQTAADKFTIMGGDTNHALCQGNKAMIGDYDHPTNLDIVSDLTTAERLNIAFIHGVVMTDEISVQQESKPVKKRYDGFFVCPNQTARVVAKGVEGRYFKLENGKLSVEKIDSQIKHHSKIGQPFLESLVKLPAKPFISSMLSLQRGSTQNMRLNKKIIKQAKQAIQKSEAVRVPPPLRPNRKQPRAPELLELKKDLEAVSAIGIIIFVPMLIIFLLAFFNIVALPFLPFAIAAAGFALVAGLAGAGLVFMKYKAQQSGKSENNNYQKPEDKGVCSGLSNLGGKHTAHSQPETHLNLESRTAGDKLFKPADDNSGEQTAHSATNIPTK